MPFKTTLLTVLALALLSGCGGGTDLKETPKGDLGTGSTGPSLSSTQSTQTLAAPDGTWIGSLTLDLGYFTPLYSAAGPTDDLYALLASSQSSLQLSLVRILGRPDTACRYQAALLARDQGFTTGDAGFKTNQQGLELYQARASNNADFRVFTCAKIKGQVGVILSAQASSAADLEAIPFYGLLHSLKGL